ncbi:MAG: PH domain-containing protein [Georgenia sp.]
MAPNILFRPVASRVSAVVAWLVAAVVAGAVLDDGGMTGLVRFGAVPLLLAGFAWAVLWWPSVRVTADGVEVANVARTTRVPWSAILGVETRWGLRLLIPSGKLDVWAAPARGARLRRGGDAVTVAEVIEARLADRRDAAVVERPAAEPRTDPVQRAAASGSVHRRVNAAQLAALVVPALLVATGLLA